jgi:hypothetical protein
MKWSDSAVNLNYYLIDFELKINHCYIESGFSLEGGNRYEKNVVNNSRGTLGMHGNRREYTARKYCKRNSVIREEYAASDKFYEQFTAQHPCHYWPDEGEA